LFAELEASADQQEQAQVRFAEAALHLAEGRNAESLLSAEAAFEKRHVLGVGFEAVKESFVVAVEAALALEDLSRADALLTVVEALPAGAATPFLHAQSSRFRARLASRRGDADEAERLFKRATGAFRELGIPFYLAVSLLEQGEWLGSRNRADEAEPPLAEARDVFESLQARPWLERVAGAARQPEVVS
jgi:tetratricopeptide (TPR) repeat protein